LVTALPVKVGFLFVARFVANGDKQMASTAIHAKYWLSTTIRRTSIRFVRYNKNGPSIMQAPLRRYVFRRC